MADKNESFSKEERAAMRARAKELKEAAKGEAAEKAVQDAIDASSKSDQVIANALRDIVREHAPSLAAKTYYGMPGWANADGKIVVFYQPASKFDTRYGTIGFDQAAPIDDGPMWATAFGVHEFDEASRKKITALVKNACKYQPLARE